LGLTLADLLSADWLAGQGVHASTHVDLAVRSGAELTYGTIFGARDAVLEARSSSSACVLVTGTDTLEDFAFCLELLLGAWLLAGGASLVVTGSMKPSDIEGYDGRANLQQAVQVAICPPARKMGVLVVLNDSIHLGRYVAKADSQLMGAFRSHPGPVREGRVRFYYAAPPAADDAAHSPLADARIAALDAARVAPWSRVGVWTTGVDGFVPEGLLREVRGLVLAAPGTGSLPSALLEQLAPWAARMPLVLVSRCQQGNNYDDNYYRGSREKYERRGFLLSGFEHLNAVQARSLLVFRLAAGVYEQFVPAAGRTGEGGAGGG
ncbi:putative L-asparaginase, partial [Tetrabaena socialis]